MRWSEKMPGWPAILDFRGCTGLPHSDGSVDRARASTPPVANVLKTPEPVEAQAPVNGGPPPELP